jgi:ornithine cyclodeaminase
MMDAIRVMRSTMRAHAEGTVHQPPRMVIQPPGVSGSAMFKPAHVGPPVDSFGFKALTIFPGNRDRGLETIQAFVALFDIETGILEAILEGGVITEIRTSAVSAVATDALANPDACDLAILGTGVQSRGHLLAMAEVREIRRVRVWNHSTEGATRFASWAATEGFSIEIAPTVRAAVAEADIVCTVTASAEPLVDAAWLSPGAHVNAVGAYQPHTRELHSNVAAEAAVFAVDSRAGALTEAGDLLIPMREGLVDAGFMPPELGEILLGTAPGRTSPDDITVFESLGLAIQDVAAAAFVTERARAAGVGIEVPFP